MSNPVTVQIMAKGQRLPKHKYKIHSFMDSTHNWYYLLDEHEKIVAQLAQPRHRGVPRKLLYIGGKV